MILSESDIKRIERLGYKREEFVEFRNGFWRLKNLNGHCVFLDVKTGKCKIYPYRPKGCMAYPVIYKIGYGFIIDKECPAWRTISTKEFYEKVKILKNVLIELGIIKP